MDGHARCQICHPDLISIMIITTKIVIVISLVSRHYQTGNRDSAVPMQRWAIIKENLFTILLEMQSRDKRKEKAIEEANIYANEAKGMKVNSGARAGHRLHGAPFFQILPRQSLNPPPPGEENSAKLYQILPAPPPGFGMRRRKFPICVKA